MNGVGLVISKEEDLISGPGIRIDHSRAFVEQSFIKVLKETEKASDIDNRRCPGILTQAPVLITPEEPWVLITGEGQSVDFFWTLRQLSLCLLKPLVCFPPDPLYNETVWMSQTLLCQSSFKWQLSLCCFLMSF